MARLPASTPCQNTSLNCNSPRFQALSRGAAYAQTHPSPSGLMMTLTASPVAANMAPFAPVLSSSPCSKLHAQQTWHCLLHSTWCPDDDDGPPLLPLHPKRACWVIWQIWPGLAVCC
ncbi:hypothetical protein BKA56DRAFT_587790 [Ilyonectria sp. MPI-CAGE-AT-0026]|nr:hypothetical protein BKA56DRAFT_587790 [Ilyonectria sp. MPI-CAGE-AT-0026]